MPIFIVHDCINKFTEEEPVNDKNSSLSIQFASLIETKKEFINKVVALPCEYELNKSWLHSQTHIYDNEDSNISNIVIDDSIYVIDFMTSKVLGKYTNDLQWHPFNLNEQIKIIWNKEKEKVRHPSFGIMNINKVSCSNPNILFQSSIPHKNIINIQIHSAVLQRYLNHDYIFSEGTPLIEFEMSSTQFANAITSLNSNGTPITIKYIDNRKIDDCPFYNKRIQFDEEFEKKICDIESDNNKFYKKITKILSKPNIGKHDREEIIKQLSLLKQEINNNIPYIKKQFTNQMDKTVLEAKNEFEAFIEDKLKHIGLEKFKKELVNTYNLSLEDKNINKP